VAERKTRDEVLRLVREGRERLEAALARLPADRLERPGVAGGDWSARDLMAHVAYWEARMLDRLGVETAVPMQRGTVDEVNRAVYERSRARRLDEVRAEFDDVHRLLRERVAALSDDELNRVPPGRDGHPELLWQYVAGETWDHYPEHVAVLESRTGTTG
jgi:uncharacterized protein (TIGR03083 family)